MRLILLFSLAFFSLQATAYFQQDLLKKKSAKVQAKQWTLADWLAQKQQASLQDHWLALHSSSDWFELGGSAGYETYKLKTDSGTSDQNGQVYRGEAYLAIFNLAGEFEKTNDRREAYSGALGVRLLGISQRSTSLVLRYGERRLNDFAAAEHWQNQFAEGRLELYVFGFFGIDGSYRYYLPDTSNLGDRLSGHRATAGAFLEYGVARVGAQYFWEPLRSEAGGVTQTLDRQGLELNATLFF